jgi:signal transduction histidine kinase
VVSRASEDAVLLAMTLSSEQDVFDLRRYGKAAAGAAGLTDHDQVRFATALSEAGRDLLRPGRLAAAFTVSGGEPAALRVTLRWDDLRAPSRESLEAIGRLLGRVSYEAAGDRLVVRQALPRHAGGTSAQVERIRRALQARSDSSLAEGLRAQTRDLIAALEQARAQSEELQRLNVELEETNQGVLALYTELSQELEETNRGVVALYAELDEKSRLLREASESKTRFWSNVSHELRTPVNSVIGLSRLLLDPGSEILSGEQHRQISLMGSAGRQLLVLVDELLDVSKAEAGQLEPQYGHVDLNTVLLQLRGLMAGMVPAGVRLEIPQLPGGIGMVCDEVMLTRILRNLLSNSLKFTDRGEVGLEVREETAGRLVFTVRDTGVGIPPDQHAKVFEEFYQVPGPHQRGRSGTGLGLPYARRLAGLLGGILTLDSAPGRGTLVSLRLPSAPPPDAGLTIRSLGSLLLADDDPVFREAIRPALRQIAHQVVEVGEGSLVAETARRERPDAMLIDVHMPDVDGYAVVAELAVDPVLCGVPVLVITSADLSAVERERLGHARAVVRKTGLSARRLAELLGLVDPYSTDPHFTDQSLEVPGTVHGREGTIHD